MTSILKSKKGVSPLIATILLIAFAVALGAVVMNIGKTKILAVDSSTVFSILELSGEKQICYFDKGPDSLLEVTIKNGGDYQIEDFQLSLIGSVDLLNQENMLTSPLAKAEVKKLKVPFNKAIIGIPQKIILTPEVQENGVETMKKGIELEDIPLC